MTRALLLVAALFGSLFLSVPAASAAPSTTWLCRPGTADPCGGGTDAPVDCFYVYPTASLQPAQSANLDASPELAFAAAAQARPFGSVCNVWAPVYRQATLLSLATADGPARDAALAEAYVDIDRAWTDFLAQRDSNRGVVLLGHSQGSRMLRTLLQNRIEPDPAARDVLVSAIIPGISVRMSDFTTVAPCTDASETGCVVAYSTFSRTPPPDSRYGGDGILCTNPASLGANARTPVLGPLPNLTAQCDGDNVLMIDGTGASALPTLPNATWGLHLFDLTIPQQTLVDLVRSQSAAFTA
ncbi:DUF3089 domain-containing protein [Rhodococcus sp. SORGH_AS_0301]|uniref:DUF3089 domain-containing protein n=1 Tax=Rhodococcus sp. SORGH_AS_0301 TaxID=3041780 RepID=UPI0027846F73|nr:DUF3089 domain-containing protein [Rhodococcus sp. SORGH_AS_0301]MDQ1181371.1 hypothetical protein [Rhodococcus sp. SORGH_AS_0301]